jgi:opacity protein-like surface antigen
MKKLIIASIIAIAAGTAFAGSATAEYQAADGEYGEPDNTALSLSVKENITKTVAVDIGINQTQTLKTKSLSTRTEIGGTYSQPVGPVTAGFRVGLGEKFKLGTATEYWSVEPSATYAVNDKVSVKVGYRYRTAFDSAVADQTRTSRLSASYAITKQDSIGVRYDLVRGDTNNNVVTLGYTRSF